MALAGPLGSPKSGLVSSLCGAPLCLASYFWHGALGKAPSPFAGLSLHGQNRLSRPHPSKRFPGARSRRRFYPQGLEAWHLVVVMVGLVAYWALRMGLSQGLGMQAFPSG